ncbi:MAG: hypothetical protein JNJ58_02405 [Chitinophagaceae bacterium]|nr:hypothetical protein [Chitinophagaceae bacterium]
MRKETTQIFLVALVIFITATLRVVNAEAHLYNLVPVAALGLFSGSILQNKRWAYTIPLAAMLLSDLGLALFTHIQGFYGISQIVNYLALALITWMGTRLHKRNMLNIAGYTLSGSLIFFLLSNFGTWLGGYYAYSFAGLTECFTMALPFYKSEMATSFFVNSLFGDLIFSGIAFGLFALLTQKRQLARIR